MSRLFDKIAKFFGFGEDENPNEEPPAKAPKPKDYSTKPTYAQYDLANSRKDLVTKENLTTQNSAKTFVENENFDVIKVQNQIDIQNSIEVLKTARRLKYDFSNVNQVDFTRMMDFLSGVAFALSGEIIKIDNDEYIIRLGSERE